MRQRLRGFTYHQKSDTNIVVKQWKTEILRKTYKVLLRNEGAKMADPKTESLEHMSFEFLELLRKKNPAWRLLASPQATLVAAFLYKEFISENRRVIAEQELVVRLENYIYFLNQGRGEALFSRSGREYLDEWANDDHGWLRKFYPSGKDEPHFDVTSLAQKAIEWLLSLRQQSFIGTESRLYNGI